MGFGMLYGALAGARSSASSLGRGFALPTAPSWWLSLAYLALAGSVLAFACFLTLQDRLGPGPAGTVGVMTPLLALARLDALRGLSARPADRRSALALAVAGNVLMLSPARSGRRGGSGTARRQRNELGLAGTRAKR